MTGSQRQAPDVLPLGAVRAALMAASAPAPGHPGDAYAPDNRAPVYPVPVGPPAGDQPGPTTPRAVRPGVVGPSAVRQGVVEPGVMGPGAAPPGPTAAWPPPPCATTSARETLVPMTPADPALETPVAAPVLPGPVGRWLRSHPRAADSGLALFVFLLGSLSTVLQAQNPLAFQAIGVPGLVLLALAQTTAGTALALRRIRPLTTWAVVILVMPVTEILTVLVLDPEKSALLYVSSMLMLTLLIGVPLMLGTLTVRVRTRWAWLAWVASTLAVQVPQIVLERYTFLESAMTLIALALVNMIGVLVGLNARSQRQRLAEVEARSARASLEREQTALLAAANERSRIAREMHDVVAHSLAVMITMADGVAATIDRNPEMAKEALGMLAETGRSALADTRRLVGVLRDDPGATSAPSGHPGAAGTFPAGPARRLQIHTSFPSRRFSLPSAQSFNDGRHPRLRQRIDILLTVLQRPFLQSQHHAPGMPTGLPSHYPLHEPHRVTRRARHLYVVPPRQVAPHPPHHHPFQLFPLLVGQLSPRRHVVAIFPKARQHFARHPFPERPCLRLPALKDQRIHSGLVDERKLLLSTKGVTINDTLFVIVEPAHCLAAVIKSKQLAHIFGRKPRLILNHLHPYGCPFFPL